MAPAKPDDPGPHVPQSDSTQSDSTQSDSAQSDFIRSDVTGRDFTGPDLCRLSARDVVALLNSRDICAADLVKASLTRIDQTSPAINAMVTRCPQRAMDAATRLDTAREARATTTDLGGLPIGIKDLTPVAGVRTTYGTPGLAEFVPRASDPLVTRLEERGAVVIGKTNTPEMGAGGNTFNPVFGATRNPWDTRMNASGSSGGAAAGLAAGEVWLSQGSDLGGSLRTPASFCGVVGLRPSPGVAGGAGGADGFNRMGVEGPMARSVADLALFLDAMAGFDPVWPVSFPAPATRYLDTCLADPGAIRIAFSPDLGGLAPVDPGMADILARAVQSFQAPGITVEEATPALSGIDSCFRCLRALGMWTGSRATPRTISQQYKPVLSANIAQGGALSVDEIADAHLTRSRLYTAMRGFLQRYDVLACPVTGIAPLPVEVEFPREVAGVACDDYLDWLRFAFLATVCGLPAMSLPVGFTSQGLPVGLQLIGPPRGEGRLLQIAHRLSEILSLPSVPIDPVLRH